MVVLGGWAILMSEVPLLQGNVRSEVDMVLEQQAKQAHTISELAAGQVIAPLSHTMQWF